VVAALDGVVFVLTIIFHALVLSRVQYAVLVIAGLLSETGLDAFSER